MRSRRVTAILCGIALVLMVLLAYALLTWPAIYRM